MARQTKITFETDSLLIVRGQNSARAWCPRCAADSEMIALENIGVISNLPHATSGGTGAFLGVGGEMRSGVHPSPIPTRVASMLEDPAYRRVNGGGRTRVTHTLIPAFVPTVDAAGIWHADFSPVTAASPARAGEVLILRATNLGPTTPDVSPTQEFSPDTTYTVNAPVEITIGGKTAEVVNKIGWPRATGVYRVDVRVPEVIPAGAAPLQLTAAWMRASELKIAIK